MRSISVRDCALLFTGLRIGSSLISLVSFSTSEVAATIAAFRAALLETLARWDGLTLPAPADCRARRTIIAKVKTVTNASNRVVRFDIMGFRSYSPLNVLTITAED
jgi:hypothetical protein